MSFKSYRSNNVSNLFMEEELRRNVQRMARINARNRVLIPLVMLVITVGSLYFCDYLLKLLQ